VILFNSGVHCNDPNSSSCIDDFMRNVLEPSLEAFSSTSGEDDVRRDKQQQQGTGSGTTGSNERAGHNEGHEGDHANPFTVLWREHEPQHFQNPGGVFNVDGRHRPTKCRQVLEYNNFRNRQAEEYLRKHKLLGKGKVGGIVRIFEALKPLWKLHYSDGKDCTHYCFSPWRFEVTWHGMYSTLLAPI
jgi:hypothetical protein